MDKKKILITGAAGFIGFHLCKKILETNEVIANNPNYKLAEKLEVIGIDNLNDYYDVSLKNARLEILKSKKDFTFKFGDIADTVFVKTLFQEYKFDYVVNLAAQAGVRYSLKNPYIYIESNIKGFLNILESCRYQPVKHLVYASSSSVYGGNKNLPFSTEHNVDHPISLYAATKKSNELMAHTYSHLFNIPTTGLRFFTVYGPWGRPDMALFLFTKAILKDEPINVFNNGQMRRDFTYIDDIIEGVYRIIFKPAIPDKDWHNIPKTSTSFAPYKIYNIGNNQPVYLLDFIEAIEKKLNKKSKRNYLEMQPGDVSETCADVEDLFNAINFKPNTSINDGISKFIDWYLYFYHQKK